MRVTCGQAVLGMNRISTQALPDSVSFEMQVMLCRLATASVACWQVPPLTCQFVLKLGLDCSNAHGHPEKNRSHPLQLPIAYLPCDFGYMRSVRVPNFRCKSPLPGYAQFMRLQLRGYQLLYAFLLERRAKWPAFQNLLCFAAH